ncbi:MAG: tripartite tricarboxylate transporter substrate binding protein, partial [Proteobacteria bacterium]|nr:tripartite tricarboxylate transporter substrate binding protein [Burkholderiales bacterium]
MQHTPVSASPRTLALARFDGGRVFAITLALACAMAQSPSAQAQAWPAKPLRWIVPFPPGGGNDSVARSVGQHLSEALRQQVVIDNRAGAGGAIGADLAA